MICIGKNKEYAQLLLRFSKENNIYQEVIGILNGKKVGVRDYKIMFNSFNSFDTVHKLRDFFNSTMTWSATKEKFDFWYEIHLKWILFLKRNSSEKNIVYFEDHCRKIALKKMYEKYKDEFRKISSNQLD